MTGTLLSLLGVLGRVCVSEIVCCVHSRIVVMICWRAMAGRLWQPSLRFFAREALAFFAREGVVELETEMAADVCYVIFIYIYIYI